MEGVERGDFAFCNQKLDFKKHFQKMVECIKHGEKDLVQFLMSY